jgi:hypothetical protein
MEAQTYISQYYKPTKQPSNQTTIQPNYQSTNTGLAYVLRKREITKPKTGRYFPEVDKQSRTIVILMHYGNQISMAMLLFTVSLMNMTHGTC